MEQMTMLILSLSLIIGSIFVGINAGVIIPTVMLYRRSHTLILRDRTSNNQRVRKFSMVEVTDKKTGNKHWKNRFWSGKYRCEIPPPEAVDLDKRGNMVVEAIRLGEYQHLWLRPRDYRVEEEIVEEKGKKIKKHYIEGLDVDGNMMSIYLEPFTQTEKTQLMNEYEKAQLRNKNKWTPEKVTTVVSIGVLAMIIALAFVFGGDILKGHNENLKVQQGIADTNKETMGEIGKIIQALNLPQSSQEQKEPLVITEGEDIPNGDS